MMGCHFVETSAKTAIGVRRVFRGMVERIVDNPELRVVLKPSSPPSSFTRPQDLRYLRYSPRPQNAMTSYISSQAETVESV
jgi:hypothetical protein